MNEQSDLGKRGRGVAPTLADVARTAGVSVSTAGRVLRDQGWPVEEGLKQRVLAAAAQLAYVPNVMARTLRGGAPAAVGLIVGNMLDPYYGEIAEIVTKHAEQMAGKMLVMVCNMQRDPALEIDYCRRLWEHRVAGLILAGGGFDQTTRHDELAELLARMERSGVTITTLSPRGLPSPEFSVDHEEVGRMAAQELIASNHRRVGVFIGAHETIVLGQRLRRATDTLDAAGVTYRIARPAPGSRGEEAIAEMFAADPGITGVIAASSLMSARVVGAVTATGRSVPQDVSVVGIGGAALAEWSPLKLTRIDLDLSACGRAALDHIATQVTGVEDHAPAPLQPRLVRGDSVRSL